MRSRSKLAFSVAIAIGSFFHCTSTVAGEPDKVARAKVSEGIKQFSSGNYTEAVNAFSEAAEVEPENSIIKFDKACALMASGDDSTARELLLQSALSKDVQVASAAYYNLACIALKQGRAHLGDNPLEADKEARDKSIERLQAADAHFRDCLRIDPSNKDARYNLELLRNFVNYLQSQWKRIDHQLELEQKDLFEFLQQLDDQQAELRQSAGRLSIQSGGKPPRFERQKLAASQAATSQDASLLEERIQQFLSAANTAEDQSNTQSANPSTSNNQLDESTSKIKELLQKIVAQTMQDMQSAADNITASNWASTLKAQRSALDHLREIYALLQELPGLLDREIAMQEALIALHDSKAISSENKQNENSNVTQPKQKQVDDSPDSQAWQQQWITLFTQALVVKARAMQQAMPNDESSNLPIELTTESPAEPSPSEVADDLQKTPTDRAPTDRVPTDQASDEQMQLQQLRNALSKILERSPEIIDLSNQASEKLSKKQFEAAKPNQLEVLRLLKELAESLPKQPPQDSKDNQQNDQKNDQKNKNQDKNNQQKDQSQEQDSKDDSQQNSDQQNSEKQDQKSDPSNKSDSQQENSGSKDQENKEGSEQQNNSTPDESDSKSQQDQPEEKDSKKPDEKQSSEDKKQSGDKEKQDKPKDELDDKQSGSKSDEKKAEEKSDPTSASSAENANATEADKQQQAKQLAEQRAQAILRRIREREAKYRELLQQLRELQGKRSPVDKDW